MSKYADIEQIKEVIRSEWVKYIPMDLDINLSFVLGKISEVPTIEVEDAISREYLKSFGYINKGDFNSVKTIREWIDNAPSVIPKPKEGEWIYTSDKSGYIGNPVEQCSICGAEYEQAPFNYCPNCGAKMKGVDDEREIIPSTDK